jgi:hypothetical protein
VCCCCLALRRLCRRGAEPTKRAQAKGGARHASGPDAKYAVSFGADEGSARDEDGLDIGFPDLITGDLGDLFEMTDVLVDEPTPSAAAKSLSMGKSMLSRGGRTQQTYEELAENNLSDCSADDFDALFDNPPK